MTPLPKSAAKADTKATKDDKVVASTPKSAKAPAKRKLVEKADTAAVATAKPSGVDKDKPKCKQSSPIPN